MRNYSLRIVYGVLFCVITTSSWGQADVNRKIFANLQQYSLNGHCVVSLLDKLPKEYDIDGVSITLSSTDDPSFWVDGRSDEDVINSLGTVVHESVHGLTSRLAYQMLTEDPNIDYEFSDDFSAFFLDKEEIYLVKHTEVFSSNELKKTIPEKLQTFRYSPYIAPKRNLGSQVEGIYGLMDEWNAYCQGTRTSLDILKGFMKDGKPTDPSIYLDLVSNAASSRFAYYEFKYYILKYMEMARKRHGKIYREILDNEQMREAYTAIDRRFAAINEDFDHQLETIVNWYAEDSGVRVRRRDGFFFVNGSGVGLFDEDFAALQQELTRQEMINLHGMLVL